MRNNNTSSIANRAVINFPSKQLPVYPTVISYQTEIEKTAPGTLASPPQILGRHPSKDLFVIGVTGTNEKITVTYLNSQIYIWQK